MNTVKERPSSKIGSHVKEELYYISHIIDSLGVEEGFHWLACVETTRRIYGCKPLLEHARELDELEAMYERRN